MVTTSPSVERLAVFDKAVAFYRRGGDLLWCADCVGDRVFTDPDEWDVRRNWRSSDRVLYYCRICGKTNRKEPDDGKQA